MKQMKFYFLLAVLTLSGAARGQAQTQSRHDFFLGTQVPVQSGIGYGYNFTDHYALRGQFGFLTPPYDKIIIQSMEWFGFDQRLSKALDESFRLGTVLTLSPQYRFGNNFVMLQGQYAHLNGSITLQRAAELYLNVDLPDLSSIPFLPVLQPELTTRSNLFILGLNYGRRFPLPNTPLSLQLEAGFAKIMGSANRFSSSLGSLDNISLIQGYYQRMDDRLRDSYWKYGYIPSVSVYLVYHLNGAQ